MAAPCLAKREGRNREGIPHTPTPLHAYTKGKRFGQWLESNSVAFGFLAQVGTIQLIRFATMHWFRSPDLCVLATLVHFRGPDDTKHGSNVATHQGMTVLFSQQEAGLAVASLVAIGVLCAMCVSCRKRPRIIREENVTYHQELVREGRRFTVIRSKTVRLNEAPRDLPPIPRYQLHRESPEVICATPAAAEDQASYQNVPKSELGLDCMYVNPIPNLVYQNVTTADADEDEDSYSYENVFPTLQPAISQDSDHSDYENTSFLEEMKEQEDEPDYVNTES
ncbi:hypothetical protein SKAU_G00327540 [Synaphobranchus kaupii]|uniref:Linker for activation of T-cells family member 2 n=1 Tax=Synaphobranchus kaupii TaxID=118154 RepID=A0A9Q1IKE5_SYNKA|nr:hypothetical protein SKAU_G00327540 [Synaphobranchus kaupii]